MCILAVSQVLNNLSDSLSCGDESSFVLSIVLLSIAHQCGSESYIIKQPSGQNLQSSLAVRTCLQTARSRPPLRGAFWPHCCASIVQAWRIYIRKHKIVLRKHCGYTYISIELHCASCGYMYMPTSNDNASRLLCLAFRLSSYILLVKTQLNALLIMQRIKTLSTAHDCTQNCGYPYACKYLNIYIIMEMYVSDEFTVHSDLMYEVVTITVTVTIPCSASTVLAFRSKPSQNSLSCYR